jgi:hypothetical protein
LAEKLNSRAGLTPSNGVKNLKTTADTCATCATSNASTYSKARLPCCTVVAARAGSSTGYAETVVTLVGDRYTDNLNTTVLPGYGRWDALAGEVQDGIYRARSSRTFVHKKSAAILAALFFFNPLFYFLSFHHIPQRIQFRLAE